MNVLSADGTLMLYYLAGHAVPFALTDVKTGRWYSIRESDVAPPERPPSAPAGAGCRHRHRLNKFCKCIHCGMDHRMMTFQPGECELAELLWLMPFARDHPPWGNPDLPIFANIARLTAIAQDIFPFG